MTEIADAENIGLKPDEIIKECSAKEDCVGLEGITEEIVSPAANAPIGGSEELNCGDSSVEICPIKRKRRRPNRKPASQQAITDVGLVPNHKFYMFNA